MASIKAVSVREALMLKDYTCNSFTHHKILVLMVPIIKEYKVICPLHKRLKNVDPIVFYPFLYFDYTSMGLKCPKLVGPSSYHFSKLHASCSSSDSGSDCIFLCICKMVGCSAV